MPKTDSLVIIVTVGIVVLTHDLAKGVLAGVLMSAITFVWRIAKIKVSSSLDQEGKKKSKHEVIHNRSSEALTLQRQERMERVLQVAKEAGVPYKINFLRGEEPGPTIVEYANKNNFDVIVIGSRGLNALQEFVLGSVSHKVAKRANCPVLIVK